MSPTADDALTSQPGFPRVSGDEPLAAGTDTKASMFSPRERG